MGEQNISKDRLYYIDTQKLNLMEGKTFYLKMRKNRSGSNEAKLP